ncbi:Lrp/AsnC family transcriptional regulator [Streptomyces sp. KHY 26]|uniref:Lrp/AsnC family transcriptional regulator n=1 Tax=Streptomyces sp. KHY 26 TaxID=3097359 RepID=UPI00376F144A
MLFVRAVDTRDDDVRDHCPPPFHFSLPAVPGAPGADSVGCVPGGSVGLSRPAASARIRRLEENGVVTGYRTVVDPAALGLNIRAETGRPRCRHALRYSVLLSTASQRYCVPVLNSAD